MHDYLPTAEHGTRHKVCPSLQVLGAKRKTLAGFSTATAQPHQGFIYTSDVIQQTPPALRGKASRMVGAKCTLLARMDAYGQDPSGQAGEAMKVSVPVPIRVQTCCCTALCLGLEAPFVTPDRVGLVLPELAAVCSVLGIIRLWLGNLLAPSGGQACHSCS